MVVQGVRNERERYGRQVRQANGWRVVYDEWVDSFDSYFVSGFFLLLNGIGPKGLVGTSDDCLRGHNSSSEKGCFESLGSIMGYTGWRGGEERTELLSTRPWEREIPPASFLSQPVYLRRLIIEGFLESWLSSLQRALSKPCPPHHIERISSRLPNE